MYQYIGLTDEITLAGVLGGNITLNLTGSPYELVSYAPGVAYRNDNELGPLYADIQDTITIHITGWNAADALENLNAINVMLDQAWRWRNGQHVPAVRIQIQAQDSELPPLEAVIYGRPPGSGPPISTVPKWNENIGRYVIENVTLQFTRRGQLLNPVAEVSALTSATVNPTVQTIVFPNSVTTPSPTKLHAYAGSGSNNHGYCKQAVLLTAPDSSRLQIYEAENPIVLLSELTVVSDTANQARGNNVLRYTPIPGDLSTEANYNLVGGGFNQTSRRVAVWAAVRNNSVTTNFFLQAAASFNNMPSTIAGIVPIDTNNTLPRLVFLGNLSSRLPIQQLSIKMSASAASGSLDIDYFVVQAIDNECSGSVAIHSAGAVTSMIDAHFNIIDPRPLSDVTALVTQTPQSNTLNYSGNPSLVTVNNAMAAVWVGVGGGNGSSWRSTALATLGAAISNIQFQATRYHAYLTPK